MPIDVGTLTTVQWTRPAGHTVTLTVTKPDGTAVTPAPTVTESAGEYSATVACDQPGRYLLRWVDGAEVNVDTLEVWPADPRFLISLDDAAAALQWRPQDVAKNGDALRLYIAAATEVIEDITGALLIRTIVQPSDGGRTGVALWERPSEIISVIVDGSPFTRYIPNLNAAIVYATPKGERFTDGYQNVVITYRTGSESISPSIQLGARELVRHLWQVGQQAMTDGAVVNYGDDSKLALTRTGFAVPRRVIELCGNHHALPGTA